METNSVNVSANAVQAASAREVQVRAWCKEVGQHLGTGEPGQISPSTPNHSAQQNKRDMPTEMHQVTSEALTTDTNIGYQKRDSNFAHDIATSIITPEKNQLDTSSFLIKSKKSDADTIDNIQSEVLPSHNETSSNSPDKPAVSALFKVNRRITLVRRWKDEVGRYLFTLKKSFPDTNSDEVGDNTESRPRETIKTNNAIERWRQQVGQHLFSRPDKDHKRKSAIKMWREQIGKFLFSKSSSEQDNAEVPTETSTGDGRPLSSTASTPIENPDRNESTTSLTNLKKDGNEVRDYFSTDALKPQSEKNAQKSVEKGVAAIADEAIVPWLLQIGISLGSRKHYLARKANEIEKLKEAVNQDKNDDTKSETDADDANSLDSIDRDLAAESIQAHARGFKARKDHEKQKSATIKLQSIFRGYLKRAEFAFLMISNYIKQKDEETRNNAAVIIQKNLRRLLSSKAGKLIAERKNEAAYKIQNHWKKIVKTLKRNSNQHDTEENTVSTENQSCDDASPVDVVGGIPMPRTQRPQFIEQIPENSPFAESLRANQLSISKYAKQLVLMAQETFPHNRTIEAKFYSTAALSNDKISAFKNTISSVCNRPSWMLKAENKNSNSARRMYHRGGMHSITSTTSHPLENHDNRPISRRLTVLTDHLTQYNRQQQPITVFSPTLRSLSKLKDRNSHFEERVSHKQKKQHRKHKRRYRQRKQIGHAPQHFIGKKEPAIDEYPISF